MCVTSTSKERSIISTDSTSKKKASFQNITNSFKFRKEASFQTSQQVGLQESARLINLRQVLAILKQYLQSVQECAKHMNMRQFLAINQTVAVCLVVASDCNETNRTATKAQIDSSYQKTESRVKLDHQIDSVALEQHDWRA